MLNSLYNAFTFTFVWLIIVPCLLAFLLGFIANSLKKEGDSEKTDLLT